MKQFIDLSHPLNEQTPPYPGDPTVNIVILNQTSQSDRLPRENFNIGRLETCLHCGTHLDAPFHFFGDGKTIEQVDLDACCGPATLIDLGKLPDRYQIERVDLEPFADRFNSTKRVIFRTGWQWRWQQPGYFFDHPVLSGDAAKFLVEQNIVLVGVDFPSVDQAPHPAHLELLGSGVLILENLTNLDRIPSDQFELIALPLAITGRDGSPVRAVARVD